MEWSRIARKRISRSEREHFSSCSKPGRYLLIDAAAWTGAEPTLGAVEKTVKSRRTCTLVREGGKLYVNVERPGLAIIVR